MDLRARVAADGYALVPGLARGVSTERIAADLGDPMTPWGGGVVQELTPRAVSTPNTYSGIFGMGRFPFHTDLAHWPLPPRYLILRCVRGYADVPTLILDGHSIAASVGDGVMRRALVRPRRPRDGGIRMVRLLQSEDVGDIVRWDEAFLLPASPVAKSAFSRFRDLLGMAASLGAVMVDDGDVLVIDNWRMLHARPAIPAERRDRRLERVYLRSLA